MKNISLLDQYKLSLKTHTIYMPAASALIILVGIVMTAVLRKYFYIGLIVIAFGLFILGEYFLIRRYLLKKIKSLSMSNDNEK